MESSTAPQLQQPVKERETDHNKNVPTDAAPRTNFPLPNELKDKIYDYLLSNEWVETPAYGELNHTSSSQSPEHRSREWSLAPTYRFHLSVLGVNREIRDEALSRLRLNSFIVVSHQMRGLAVLKHNFDVPLVTERHVSAFEHYDMRLHIQAPKSILALYEKENLRSFVILAKHLPELCRVVQWRYYSQPPSFPLVAKKNGMAAHISYNFRISVAAPSGQVKFQTKIKFSSEAKQRLSIKKMTEMLKPLNDMIVGNQSVTLCNNFEPELDIEDLRRRMGPSAVWPKAMAWHIFETIQALLGDAEKFIESGNFMHACRRYRFIADICRPCFIFNLPPLDHNGAAVDYSDDTILPIGLTARAILDALATFGRLHMRVELTFGSSEDLLPTVEGLYRILDQLPDPLKRQLAPFYDRNVPHLDCAGHSALQLFLYSRTEETLFEVMDIFNELHSLSPSDQHIAFDREIVKQTIEDASRRSDYLEATPDAMDLWQKILTLLGQLSVCQLPVKIVKSELPVGITKPVDLDGFVDCDHLASIRAKAPDKARQISDGTLMALESKGARFFHTNNQNPP